MQRSPRGPGAIDGCRTIVLDKTGTLTYGAPTLTDRLPAPGTDDWLVLRAAASVERYSKHPLAMPILEAAAREHLVWLDASAVRERPGDALEADLHGTDARGEGRHAT